MENIVLKINIKKIYIKMYEKKKQKRIFRMSINIALK